MAADGSQEVAKDAMHIVTIDTCNLIKGKPESGDGSVCLSVVQFTVFLSGLQAYYNDFNLILDMQSMNPTDFGELLTFSLCRNIPF